MNFRYRILFKQELIGYPTSRMAGMGLTFKSFRALLDIDDEKSIREDWMLGFMNIYRLAISIEEGADPILHDIRWAKR